MAGFRNLITATRVMLAFLILQDAQGEPPSSTKPTAENPATVQSQPSRRASMPPMEPGADSRSSSPTRRAPAPAEPVTFPTLDNLLIAGSYTPPARRSSKAPMAILLHASGSDRSVFESFVPALHSAGFTVLAIDLRGHGQSVGPAPMQLAERAARRDKRLLAAMHRDVEAAYRWLSAQQTSDPARFVLVGAGAGFSVALDYAARDRSVDGILCLLAGGDSTGFDDLATARKYGPRPLLIVGTEADLARCAGFNRAEARVTMRIIPVPEAGTVPPQGAQLLEKLPDLETPVVQFLLEAAGVPASHPVLASLQGEVYHPADTPAALRIKPENTRWFSSAEEAEARGLRPARRRSSSRSAQPPGAPAVPPAAAPGSGRQ